MFIVSDNLCSKARIRKLLYVSMSFLPGSEEEETANRDVELGLDKVDSPVNVKPIALERLIMTTRGLSLADTLRRMTPKNNIRKLI